jgi:uncharacterized GH25 family protein
MNRRGLGLVAEVRMRAVPRLFPVFLVAALAAAAPRAARAHDFFILPSESFPKIPATVEIGMHVTETFPGEPESWRVDRTREFFMVDSAGRTDLKSADYHGSPMKAFIPLQARGSVVFAVVTEPSYIEVPPQHFLEYLTAEGHEAIVKARQQSGQQVQPGKERYTRYVKTLVHAAAEPTATAIRTLGLPIEIVPGAQVATLKPGDTLPVKVILGGKPFPNGLLCATYAGHSDEEDTYAWCGRLDADGKAAVPIQAIGWQLIRITHMQARQDDPKADWESWWASLTFEIPKKLPKPQPTPKPEKAKSGGAQGAGAGGGRGGAGAGR